MRTEKMLNISEAITQIKAVGANSVRVVPMPSQNVDGDHQIEINQDGKWTAIVVGVKRAMAEDIVRQATNRVLLG
jgi:hypothetical protein